MIIKNSEISFYVDTMIVETLLSNESLYKTAQASGLFSQLIDKVKNYFGNHIDPNDKSGSLLNMLAPGAISIIFSSLGFGWLGALLGLAMSVFQVDVKGILSSIWNKLKNAISGDKQTTSDEIDEMVNSSVQEHSKPATEEEAASALSLLENRSAAQLLRDAKMLKVALIEYDNHLKLHKKGGPSFLSMFSGRKSTTMNLLTKVLGWIFKVAVAAAGLLVAGDVINKFLGRPNALDDTIQDGKPITQPSTQEPAIIQTVSKQTKFPVKTTYTDKKYNIGSSNWVENIPNDESSIGFMLVQFAKDVYSGLDGKEAIIRTSPAFEVIRDRIVIYNRSSAGDSMVFIPKYFTSKKQIVDMFIDDVAENT